MTIGIYSPYLDTAGGGERYMLTIAEFLSQKNSVDVFLDSHLQTLDIKKIESRISKLLNLDLSKVNFVKAPFGKGSKNLERLMFLKKYDVLFYLTDGSIFYSSARKSFLHIQSPIKISKNSFFRKVKQTSWNSVIYNSEFTKNESQKYWQIKGKVIYPPVNIDAFKSKKAKENIIVSVGRFSGTGKDERLFSSKKQEIMIQVFKKIIDSKKADGWSLHLAGGAQDEDKEFIEQLRKLGKGYPISIHPNLEFSVLKDLYAKAKIYWHAAGFGEENPERKEHFGITTVEAMASGSVPIVINSGGQSEIVKNGENGFLWETQEELENKTIELISNTEKLAKFRKNSESSVSKFSDKNFEEKINQLISNEN